MDKAELYLWLAELYLWLTGKPLPVKRKLPSVDIDSDGYVQIRSTLEVPEYRWKVKIGCMKFTHMTAPNVLHRAMLRVAMGIVYERI
jgi:hypothetical protein